MVMFSVIVNVFCFSEDLWDWRNINEKVCILHAMEEYKINKREDEMWREKLTRHICAIINVLPRLPQKEGWEANFSLLQQEERGNVAVTEMVPIITELHLRRGTTGYKMIRR